jgi:hypothetical protein
MLHSSPIGVHSSKSSRRFSQRHPLLDRFDELSILDQFERKQFEDIRGKQSWWDPNPVRHLNGDMLLRIRIPADIPTRFLRGRRSRWQSNFGGTGPDFLWETQKINGQPSLYLLKSRVTNVRRSSRKSAWWAKLEHVWKAENLWKSFKAILLQLETDIQSETLWDGFRSFSWSMHVIFSCHQTTTDLMLTTLQSGQTMLIKRVQNQDELLCEVNNTASSRKRRWATSTRRSEALLAVHWRKGHSQV